MASSSNTTLENIASSSASTFSSSQDDHLSYPTITHETINEDLTRHEQPRTVLKDRLYIGNLHPSVDEFSLLQVFSKFGKVTKLDFLFHKSGAQKGKPRGYAFVEYGKADEAQKALTMAHDKLLRGRKLVVTYAHQAPLDQYGNSLGASGSRNKKSMMEVGRPTTLSMLKTGMHQRHEPKTADKIAIMEAKLKQLESTKPTSSDHLSDSTSARSSGQLSMTLPYHPSLPVKPPPPIPEHLRKAQQPNTKLSHSSRDAYNKSLPSLPILPHSQWRGPSLIGEATTSPSPTSSIPQLSVPRSTKSTKLAGVIMKSKEKAKDTLAVSPS